MGSATIGAALDVSVTAANFPSHLGTLRDQGDGDYTITYQPITLNDNDTFTITVNGVVLDATPTITWTQN